MTAYLRPGDKIILAFGVDSNTSATERDRQNTEGHRNWVATFGHHGVEVIASVSSTNLPSPVVSAVIRGRQEPTVDPSVTRYTDYADLMAREPSPDSGQLAWLTAENEFWASGYGTWSKVMW